MQTSMRDLPGQELQEAVELRRVPPQRGRQRGRIVGRRLEGAHVELQPVAKPLDPAEHAYRVALAEAPVEELDVRPDPRLDPATRIDQLERQVRSARARPPPL